MKDDHEPRLPYEVVRRFAQVVHEETGYDFATPELAEQAAWELLDLVGTVLQIRSRQRKNAGEGA